MKLRNNKQEQQPIIEGDAEQKRNHEQEEVEEKGEV